MALLTNKTVLPQTNGFIVPIIFPPGTVLPGGNTGTGTPNTGKKPTLDAILAFLAGLADSLFPGGIGGSGTTTPPIYIPPQNPAPPAAPLSLPIIGLIVGILYLLWKQ